MACTHGNKYYSMYLSFSRPMIEIVQERLHTFKEDNNSLYSSSPNLVIQLKFALFLNDITSAQRYLKIVTSLGKSTRLKEVLRTSGLVQRRDRHGEIDDIDRYEFHISYNTIVPVDLITLVNNYEQKLRLLLESDYEQTSPSLSATISSPTSSNTSEATHQELTDIPTGLSESLRNAMGRGTVLLQWCMCCILYII